jgi:hypothetical protein
MDDPRACEDSYWLMMARGSEEDSGRRGIGGFRVRRTPYNAIRTQVEI